MAITHDTPLSPSTIFTSTPKSLSLKGRDAELSEAERVIIAIAISLCRSARRLRNIKHKHRRNYRQQ